MATTAQAVPAHRQPKTYLQPDGSTITVLLHGDEWCHWTTDLEGRLLVSDESGFYRTASPAELAAWEVRKTGLLERRDRVNASRHARLRHTRQLQKRRAAAADSLLADSTITSYDPDSLVCDSLLDNHFLFPSRGKVRGLAVLVEFQDVRFTIDNPLQQYTDMLNQSGYDRPRTQGSKYCHIGSANDYFYQNSCGQFDPQFDVYGPILLKDSVKHYGKGYDDLAWEMFTEACDYLDSIGVDFSTYDIDQDDYIDFIFAFYAGNGENRTGKVNDIWPHAWDVISASGKAFRYDGKVLQDFACCNELAYGYMEGVGTFCHEFSHVLGLPDLYKTVNGSMPCTPSYYDLMDEGCYNWESFVPAGMSAYERYELGWLTPTVLSEQKTDTLFELSTTNTAFIVPITEGLDDPRAGEYYLFENRQPTGWDQHLPGHGMLAWHIDFRDLLWTINAPNNWDNHQCIDLVEAGGKKKSGSRYVQTGSTPFPGTADVTSFTDDTTPAFCGWSRPGTNSTALDVRLEKPITNIRELPYEDETGAQLGPDIITFDFRSDPDGLRAISADASQNNAPETPRLIMSNGNLLIQTAQGTFDVTGRRR